MNVPSLEAADFLDRCTERVRRVLLQAQREAVSLRHDWIGTEHLLLALAADREGIAGRVLETRGIHYTALREDVIHLIVRRVDVDAPAFNGRSK